MKSLKFLMSTVAVMVFAQAQGVLAQSVNTNEAVIENSGLDGRGDIVVTARRREENIQSVPVSVQAFSPETLQRQVVMSTTDLARITPGVVFSGAGNGTFNTTFTIRGQGRDVIGPIAPSVMSYFNDVPLPNWGAVLPTFDVANVQVLKGPQGTLFGRNTTGGAVLVNSKAPTYNVEGYASGLYGSYDWTELEGAVNVPIIKDRVAFRAAGRYAKRDGYTKSGQGFAAGDDMNERQFRLSLLLEPTDNLRNVTVYDYSRTNIVGGVLHPTGFASAAGPNGQNAVFRFFPQLFDCGTSPSCDFDLALQRSRQNPRRYWSSIQDSRGNAGAPFINATIQGVTNTTTLSLGDVTVKNIFGYRKSRILLASEGDGTEMIVIDSNQVHRADDQITDELQVSGSLFDDRLDWLAGGFYLDSKPKAPNYIDQQLFANFFNNLGFAAVHEKSKALFGSASYKLAEGLKLNGSGRYTWDDVGSCSYIDTFGSPAADGYDACVGFSPVNGSPIALAKASFKKFTWSFGADYQMTDKLFLYAVARRGYRAGGINTPNLGGSFAPYQTFGPQTVTDGEVGIKADWRAGDIRGRLNLSAYISRFRGLQVAATGIAPGADGDNNPLNDPTNTSLDFNGGKAKTHGFELDGFVEPVRGLRFEYGAAYFHGRKNGTPPAALAPFVSADPKFDNAPKLAYNLGVSYYSPSEVLGGRLVGSITYNWVDNYKVNFYLFPSHNQTNASIGIDNIGGSGLNAQVFVQNLTKELYPENTLLSGASPGVLSATYNAPRMIGFRLRYNFSEAN